MSDPETRAATILTIDLAAIAENYRTLRRQFTGGEVGAVVKADAYGLGMERAAPALMNAGCRTFFVALPDEGVALRALSQDARIFVLDGLLPGCAEDYAHHRLIPVLGSLPEIAAWRSQAPAPAALHIDTGMARLGLSAAEVAAIDDHPGLLAGINFTTIISHLACADEPNHPLSQTQLQAFAAARRILPAAEASLANSPGIFLGPAHHFDLARSGAALWGLNPTPGAPNPMKQVINLKGKILQVRAVDSPQTVGYGATHRIVSPGRLATVAIGYADGYLRSLGNSGAVYLGHHEAPVVGRVSMDLITIDVSAVAEADCRPGTMVDIIGPLNPADDMAARAGTIGYEVLTALGRRHHRTYL